MCASVSLTACVWRANLVPRRAIVLSSWAVESVAVVCAMCFLLVVSQRCCCVRCNLMCVACVSSVSRVVVSCQYSLACALRARGIVFALFLG